MTNRQPHYPIPYFTSLGLFIIDEIHFSTHSLSNILGGGGTFAICGSRMVLGADESRYCSWIVDIGKDCPAEILTELTSWNTGAVFRYDDSRECTRGWNRYGLNEFREFKYLTPKKKITVDDLKQYPWMLQSASYHLVCSAKTCSQFVQECFHNNNAIIVWEPIPDRCTEEYLDETIKVLKKVDILTPNAAECASFFGESEPQSRENCEQIGLKFLNYMTKKNSGIVLRCGALGSLLLRENIMKWFPAYHSDVNFADYRVVDPTGCGNTFVGAFATTFVKYEKSFELACIFATVASGACIEQHGLPVIEKGEVELWNGKSFQERYEIYCKRNHEVQTANLINL